MNAWRLICCQNVRNEFFVLHSMALKMCNGQQHIHVCHSDLHSACMESICFAQTFPFPNCLMRMWNTLAVDIPTFAAVTAYHALIFLKHGMNTLHMPLICWRCKYVTTRSIFLHAPTHHIWYSSTCNSYIQWGMSALHFNQEILKLLWCVPKQEMKLLSQCKPPCVWNFLAVVLGPLFMWKWKRKHSASSHHSPMSVLLAHSATYLLSGTAIQETSEKCGIKSCL